MNNTRNGNLGNDRADQLAKEATCQDMNLLMSVPLSHWKHVAWERTVSSWNTEFLASPEALWTKRLLFGNLRYVTLPALITSDYPAEEDIAVSVVPSQKV
ncbi:hypothetical protein TNCV_3011401 [Trichonephila clavipes]|nr:hypothetical protein TNCV_3011401 [Trichonephila clavipes]